MPYKISSPAFDKEYWDHSLRAFDSVTSTYIISATKDTKLDILEDSLYLAGCSTVSTKNGCLVSYVSGRS